MNYDVIVIGGGIVGLATAYNILKQKPELKLILLDKERDVALHQTGNNSGVIHSGIYYKPGSLKAKNCRHGYRLLLDFCDQNEIKYDICGKVIVAFKEDQVPYLSVLVERGRQNGLEDLAMLTGEEIKEIEPHVDGLAGIKVPQTGIVDFNEVSGKMKNLIAGLGGEFAFNSEVTGIAETNDEIRVNTADREYRTKYLVTCAGLQSDKIAKLTNPDLPLRIIPFRGEYYKLKKEKRYLVNSLIYPVPDPAFPFLGVHFTRMIDGGVEAGPNAVLAFKREGYSKLSFDFIDTIETFTWPGFLNVAKKYWKTGFGEFYRSFNKGAFVNALQCLVPEINRDDLEPGGAGVRAQACDKNGGLLDDFYIVENKRIVHVCNAPSPAATSSLSIGEYIALRLFHHMN